MGANLTVRVPTPTSLSPAPFIAGANSPETGVATVLPLSGSADSLWHLFTSNDAFKEVSSNYFWAGHTRPLNVEGGLTQLNGGGAASPSFAGAAAHPINVSEIAMD